MTEKELLCLMAAILRTKIGSNALAVDFACQIHERVIDKTWNLGKLAELHEQVMIELKK